MPDQPTATGQNMIIKNLNNILVALVITAVGGLFTWGINLSHTITEQKDLYDQTIVGLNGKIDGLQKELNDAESDILTNASGIEVVRDDLKTRIIHLEDLQNCQVKK
jgi:hypothetical protein